MRILEGNVVAEGIKIGIVAARFNEFIVSKLVVEYYTLDCRDAPSHAGAWLPARRWAGQGTRRRD